MKKQPSVSRFLEKFNKMQKNNLFDFTKNSQYWSQICNTKFHRLSIITLTFIGSVYQKVYQTTVHNTHSGHPVVFY